MVEEGTLDGSPKGGEKEELGEGEWVSLNTLSLRKIKIWQDYSISTRTQERRREGFFFVCLGMKERRSLYSSGGENMNGRPFNECWQRIMNLDLILALGKSSALNGKIGGSEEQTKFDFPVVALTAYRAKFEKLYLTWFRSELSHYCAQIEAPNV